MEPDKQQSGYKIIRAGDIYGGIAYKSISAGTKTRDAAAEFILSFKVQGRHADQIEQIVRSAAAEFECNTIIAAPGHSTTPTNLQNIFGETLVRTQETIARRYEHNKEIDFKRYAATLQLNEKPKGKVLFVDDVATTGRSLQFYKKYFAKKKIECVLFAIGINAALNPVIYRQGKQTAGKRQPGKTTADRVAAHVARNASVEFYCERNKLTDGRLGVLPAVKHPRIRRECSNDLPRFLRHYFPSIYTRPFSPAALRFLGDVAKGMSSGGQKAVAMPRGMGKTSMTIGAMIWASIYGKRKYLVAVSATGDSAKALLKDFYSAITTEEIVADFPEVAIPFLAIEGHSQRCASQNFNGELTKINRNTDYISFPCIGDYDSKGAIIQCAGLTGAVRGMHQVDTDGKWIRPDFVLLDDPQTRESAKSLTQTEDRERIILGDVMGLAGHQKQIAAVMACTVISKNDLADRFLSHELHPEWRGQKEPLVRNWGNPEHWNEYDETWKKETSGELPAGSTNKFWKANKTELEKGVEVLDDHLFSSGEISAVQHCRNLFLSVGEYSFQAEYQNDPVSLTPEAEYVLTPQDVLKKLNSRPRAEIPDDSIKVVAAIDINKYALAWTVTSADITEALAVIDYGFYTPKGKREVWTDQESREKEIASGLTQLVDQLMNHPKYGGSITTLCIDAGYSASTVYETAQALQRKYRHRRIVAARGLPGDRYFTPRNRKQVYQFGRECDIRKQYPAGSVFFFDSHYWHLQTQKGWLLPEGIDGNVTVFGNKPAQHGEFADQVTADELAYTKIVGNGRTVAIWNISRHNEQGDTLAMCAALASLGMVSTKAAATKPTAAQRKKIQAEIESEPQPKPQPPPKRQTFHPHRRGGWQFTF